MSNTTKKIISELVEYLKVKNKQGLADYLGVSVNQVYGWGKRDNIADIGSILVKNPEISAQWLRTGKGEMLSVINLAKLGAKKQQKDNQQVAATQEPDNEYRGSRALDKKETFKQLAAQNFDVIFEFIADEYGKDSAGIEDFKDDFKMRFSEYRAWREKKRTGEDHSLLGQDNIAVNGS